MTGFAADWLAVRETVDRRSRAAGLTRRAARWAKERFETNGRALRIADLGAGSGSNVRFLAPRFAVPQAWLLFDDDPVLLGAAGRCRGLSPANDVAIATRTADLAGADLGELVRGFDLITASALFDLVSASWCTALLQAAKRQRVGALLAALTYDGWMSWQEPDPFDAAIATLVNRHQRRDKGFGPALGPTAAAVLAQMAVASGATVATDTSDWRIGAADAEMHAALLKMLTTAAEEVDPAQTKAIGDWRDRRLARTMTDTLTIGHVDMLAIW